MASGFTIYVGPFQAPYESPFTDMETGAFLQDFIMELLPTMPEGLTTQQQNQWKIDQARDKILKMIRRETGRNRRRSEEGTIQDFINNIEEGEQF